jgi:hypothetical protein
MAPYENISELLEKFYTLTVFENEKEIQSFLLVKPRSKPSTRDPKSARHRIKRGDVAVS